VGCRERRGDALRCVESDVRRNSRDMKTFGPLYNSAVHAVEPRGGEAPPHPRPFPTNSNFHHSPISSPPIPYSQINSLCRFPHTTWELPPLPQNTYAPLRTLTASPLFPKILTRPPSPLPPPSLWLHPPPQKFPRWPNGFYRSKSKEWIDRRDSSGMLLPYATPLHQVPTLPHLLMRLPHRHSDRPMDRPSRQDSLRTL
jgi:hypothetical protein